MMSGIASIREVLANQMVSMSGSLLTRSALIAKLIDDRRDYDKEAGYPSTITMDMYQQTYDRFGLGQRVVGILPAESWASAPKVVETEDVEQTPFEESWEDFQTQHMVWHHLNRLDELSGIGRFGVLLMGFSDGKWRSPLPDKGVELLYLRPLSESFVSVTRVDTDASSDRFGKPILYSVSLEIGSDTKTLQVHWSRVLHVAESCVNSMIYGTPRMMPVFDRLLDAKKILAGSGEMFWRGGFPGLSFELMPGLADAEIDKTALKDEIENYQNGMQRYLTTIGLTAKSLAPQVADPTANYETILRDITITLGVPMRIFLGSEQGKLASSQDSKAWSARLQRRQNNHVSMFLIRPFIDKMIDVGLLPQPSRYNIQWSDLNTVTDEEKSNVGQKVSRALQAYVRDNVSRIMPLEPYLSLVLGFTSEEVRTVTSALETAPPEGLTPQASGPARNPMDEPPIERGDQGNGHSDGEAQDVTV